MQLTVALTSALLATALALTSGANGAGTAHCPATKPNGNAYEGEPSYGSHGNDYLVVGLDPTGTLQFVPGGGGTINRDGSLSTKFFWWRRVRGQLSIEGRRLDARAPALRARIPGGYGDEGFQATAITFPTIGCWEVTGRIDDHTLTFVVLVVRREAPE